MGNHQHGGAQIVDLLQQRHDFKGALGVQVTGRLVGDNGGGIVHQSTGNGQSLLLTTGHLMGMAVHLALQTNQLQHIGHTILNFLLPGAHHPHGEGHVLIDGHLIDQAVVLKHDADGTAQVGNLPLADPLQRVAVDMDGARGRLQLAGNQLDDGGLAGTGGADEEAEFPILDLHGNAVQRFISLFVGFYYIVKFNHMYNLLYSGSPGRTRVRSHVTEL